MLSIRRNGIVWSLLMMINQNMNKISFENSSLKGLF